MKQIDFITTRELRTITGYTLQAIARAERQGDLPRATRLGGQLFWPRQSMPQLIRGFRQRASRRKHAECVARLLDRLAAVA